MFQKAPTTVEEAERPSARPLEIPPGEVAGFDEATWYARAYRGDDVPQLTVRAVVMGSGLGFLLAITNIYLGLKVGITTTVAITACILSFSMWKLLLKLGVVRTPMSILENNCMQSTASSAGYSTGNGLVSAFPALLLLSATPQHPGGEHLPWTVLTGWTIGLAALGVIIAVPAKRSMINRDRLPFPSGLAAATTLQSLYSAGAEAARQARALLVSAIVAGVIPLLVDLNVRMSNAGRVPLLPAASPVLDWLPWLSRRGLDARTGARLSPSDWTVVLDHKLLMVGLGALIGMRVSVSMAVGGLVLACFVGPAALAAGAAAAPGRAWLDIGIWIGAPMVVAANMFSFALDAWGLWRRRRSKPDADAAGPLRPLVEVPRSWVVAGTVVAGTGIVILGQTYFHIAWPMGVLAVALASVLSLVGCRVVGETDIGAPGPLGQLVQLVYGLLVPGNPATNLMTASMTANASSSASDLLTDLKAGYLLGAHPRRQFIAQLLGVFAGTAGSVIGFHLLVPDATVMTGGPGGAAATFPAPGAQSWLAVARLFDSGVGGLPALARLGIGWGAATGAGLVLLEKVVPRASRWLPSATGVGLGVMLPFNYPLSILIGATIAMAWARRSAESADRHIVPLASGAIAGESVVGVVVAALNNVL